MAARPEHPRVGATNPELRGNVQIYTYGPGGTRGSEDAFQVTFNAADADGLAVLHRRRTLRPVAAKARVDAPGQGLPAVHGAARRKPTRPRSRALRDEIRQAGDTVRDRRRRASSQRYDAKSAAGYRVIVRQRGVAVEQALRKTTGIHPEFGALQMRRALVPALDENKDETAVALDVAFDRIAARFND